MVSRARNAAPLLPDHGLQEKSQQTAIVRRNIGVQFEHLRMNFGKVWNIFIPSQQRVAKGKGIMNSPERIYRPSRGGMYDYKYPESTHELARGQRRKREGGGGGRLLT